MTLARDSSLGSWTLISGVDEARTFVKIFCVEDSCWSSAFLFKEVMSSFFSSIRGSTGWLCSFGPLVRALSAGS